MRIGKYAPMYNAHTHTHPTNTQTYLYVCVECSIFLLTAFTLKCSSVAVGSTGGSFCDELCSSKAVKDAECLGHGVKDDVVLLHLKERKVVVKSLKDKYESFVQSSLENVDPDAEHTMSVLDIHVKNGLGFIGVDATIEELTLVERTIFKECDANGNSLLSYSELTVCLQLAFTEEYVFSLLLEGNPAVPVVYGTCGAQIAVEYIDVNPFGRTWPVSSFVTVNGLWQERAAMAIAFLDLVESIEHTPHGVLFLCDVQTSNFGLQRLDNGRYRAVAIDLDISFFEKAMASAIVQQDVCTSDEDCDFINCKSKCINGHCTKRLHSSNFQVSIVLVVFQIVSLVLWYVSLSIPAKAHNHSHFYKVVVYLFNQTCIFNLSCHTYNIANGQDNL